MSLTPRFLPRCPGRGIVVLAVLCTCARAAFAQSPPHLIPVEAVRAQPAGMQRDTYEGVVVARRSWEIGLPRGGRIAALTVSVGDKVAAGQTIAVLDQEEARASLDEAEAQWSAAQAEAEQAADAAMRANGLDRDGALSRGEVRSRQLQFAALRAKVEAAAAAVRAARAALANGILAAPADAVVTDILAEAGTSVGAGTPVVRLAAQSEEVVIRLPETAEILPQSRATVTFWNSPLTTTATLRAIAPSGEDATRLRKAWLTLAPDAPWQPLNSSVKVTPEQPVSGEVRIPLAAFDTNQGKTVAWAIQPDQSHVRPVPVTLVALAGADAIVTGLPVNQQIVANGVAELQPDTRITLVQTETLR